MSTTKLYDSLADEYEQWFEAFPLVIEAEMEALRQVTPPFERGLEVGVGTGRFAVALGIPLGVEPSEKMAAYARNRGIEVIEGVAEKLPFDDGAFDAVFMITLDCYLDDMEPALLEAHRVLEPNGHLIIGHIDIDAPLGAVYKQDKEDNVFYRDATFRGTTDVLKELERTNFEVLKIRQTIETLENIEQGVKEGYGDGVFVAICARKK